MTVFDPSPNASILQSAIRQGRNDFADSPCSAEHRDADRCLIAEAAAARGYRVEAERNRVLRVTGDKRWAVFVRSAPDMSVVASAIAANWLLSRKVLSRHGIPVPTGRVFREQDAALAYFVSCATDQVVKPVKGVRGRWLRVGVGDRAGFLAAWVAATELGRRILVEEHVAGDALSIVVLGGRAVAASCAAPIDVPNGGCIGLEGRLHPSILELAERAAAAIPGATLLGVHVLVKDFAAEAAHGNACVIGLSSEPVIAAPVFATYGTAASALPDLLMDLVEAGRHETASGVRRDGAARLTPAPVYVSGCHGKSFRCDYSTQMRLLRQAAYARNLAVESLSDELTLVSDTVHCSGFFQGMPSCTRAVARRASNHKEWTKGLLRKASVPTPAGRAFRLVAREDAWKYAQSLKAQVVVKPIVGSGGSGVSIGIATREHFDAAWKIAAGVGAKLTLVEEHVSGNDYRVVVVGNAIRAAAQRIPAHVCGDGVHTIDELVAMKNVQRQGNPYLGSKPVALIPMMLRNLREMGMDADSIPVAGQYVQLHGVANIGSGGESTDVTDRVHPGFVDIAARIRKAIYDPLHVGFDLIAEDIARSPDQQRWTVIEVNTNPDLGLHHFPAFGAARDVAGVLIEALFPGAAAGVVRRTVRVGIEGRVQGVGFRRWVWEQAHLHALQGWVRNLKDGSVEALFCGAPNAVDHMVEACGRGPKRAQVSRVEVSPCEGVVPAPFEILAQP